MNKQQIIEWLLEGDASLQYQAWRDLLGKDKKKLQDSIVAEGWGYTFLSMRHSNGHWENPIVKMLIQMLSLGAEMENNLRKERQLQGIQLAKMSGKYQGRLTGSMASKEKLLVKYNDVADLVKNSDLSIRRISEITERSINTVRKINLLVDKK